MFLFFDTETNGLPTNYKAPMTDLKNWPRVIQLAWLIVDENRLEITRKKHLISPDGWTVPEKEFWIKNGYSTAKCAAEGIPMIDALTDFVKDLQFAENMIAHNMEFDYNILGAEMIRYKTASKKKLKKYCTKEYGTEYCRIPGRFAGQYKWPTLMELHMKLFNKGFDGAHDAMFDVMACSSCFFGLVDNGTIQMPDLMKFVVWTHPESSCIGIHTIKQWNDSSKFNSGELGELMRTYSYEKAIRAAKEFAEELKCSFEEKNFKLFPHDDSGKD